MEKNDDDFSDNYPEEGMNNSPCHDSPIKASDVNNYFTQQEKSIGSRDKVDVISLSNCNDGDKDDSEAPSSFDDELVEDDEKPQKQLYTPRGLPLDGDPNPNPPGIVDHKIEETQSLTLSPPKKQDVHHKKTSSAIKVKSNASTV